MSEARPPRVSVVMPTYNRARSLPAAARSVLAQTFADLELIIVDDGSTDETRAVLQTFDDPRVRVVHRKNGGLAAALNTGFRAARGALWARLDDDDRWLPDMLAHTVAALDARPEVGFVYAQANSMNEAGEPVSGRIYGTPGHVPGDPLASLLAWNCVGPHTTLIRREHMEAVGLFDESLPSCEDWDLYLRLARVCEVGFVHRVLAVFRLHETSMSSPTDPRYLAHLDGHVRVIEKFFAAPDLPDAVRALEATARRNVHLELFLRASAVGHRAKARQALIGAITSGANPATTALRLALELAARPLLRRYPTLFSWRHRLATVARRLRSLSA